MVDFGQLMVTMVAPGVTKTTDKLEAFQKQMTGTFKKIKPQMEQLTKNFKKFGIASLLAFAKLIDASPRLRAQMEILNFRVNTLIRGFGDALAPAIEFLSDAVAALTDWFKTLPEPMQDAIFFGGAVAVTIGLLVVAFIALNAAMSPITLVILGIAAAAAILFLIWSENLFGIQDISTQVFESLGQLFGSFMSILDLVMSVLDTFFTMFDTGFQVIEAIVTGVLGIFISTFTNLVTIVSDVINVIVALISGDWTAAMEALETLVGDVIDFIIESFLSLPTILLDVVSILATAFVDGITGLLDDIAGLFTGFIDIAGDAAGAIIDAFIDGLLGGLDAAVAFVEDAIDAIAGLFGGSLPEWGPLRDALPGGGDMANKYFEDMATQIINSKGLISNALSDVAIGFNEPSLPFQGINAGFGGATNVVEHRTIIIEKIELVIPGATTDSASGFLDRLDTGIRRATKF